MIDYLRISGDDYFDIKLHALHVDEQAFVKDTMIKLVTNGNIFDVRSCSPEKRFNKLLIPTTKFLVRFERISLNHLIFFDLEVT